MIEAERMNDRVTADDALELMGLEGGRRKAPHVIYDEREALHAFEKSTHLALDLETGGLSPWRDPIAVVSLFDETINTAAVLHVRGYISDDLKHFLEEPDRLIIFHNGTCFDVLFLALNNVDIFRPKWYDTMIGALCASVTARRDVRVNLAAELNRRSGRKISKTLATSPWMSPQLTKAQLDYCVDDVQSLQLLRDRQIERCNEVGTIGALEFEHALAKPIARMILNGMPLDDDARRAWHLELQERVAQSEHRLRSNYSSYLLPRGSKRNPKPPDLFHNSSRVILNAFREEHNLRLPNTQKLTLQEIADGDPDAPTTQFASDILLTRMARKRMDMYDDDWVAQYVEVDRRVHSRYWQVATETGRSTSSEPNFQQIPRDGRRIFGGEEGKRIIKADYDSIEVVVAAALAGDEVLLEDCRTGDPHTALASWFTGVPADKLTKDQRRLAKAGNFTILFGGGVGRFYEAATLGGGGITEREATRFFNSYLERYRAIDAMRKRAFARARSRHVTLKFPTGLRRDLQGAEVRPTILINNSVQGTAAAGIKMSILEGWRAGLGDYWAAMVHDENVLCCPEPVAYDVAHELEECMVKGMRWALAKHKIEADRVPIGCKPEVSTHWS